MKIIRMDFLTMDIVGQFSFVAHLCTLPSITFIRSWETESVFDCVSDLGISSGASKSCHSSILPYIRYFKTVSCIADVRRMQGAYKNMLMPFLATQWMACVWCFSSRKWNFKVELHPFVRNTMMWAEDIRSVQHMSLAHHFIWAYMVSQCHLTGALSSVIWS